MCDVRITPRHPIFTPHFPQTKADEDTPRDQAPYLESKKLATEEWTAKVKAILVQEIGMASCFCELLHAAFL